MWLEETFIASCISMFQPQMKLLPRVKSNEGQVCFSYQTQRTFHTTTTTTAHLDHHLFNGTVCFYFYGFFFSFLLFHPRLPTFPSWLLIFSPFLSLRQFRGINFYAVFNVCSKSLCWFVLLAAFYEKLTLWKFNVITYNARHALKTLFFHLAIFPKFTMFPFFCKHKNQ